MGNYIPVTAEERLAMAAAIGMDDIGGLFADIPESVRLRGSAGLPEGKPESAVLKELSALAAKNTVFSSIFRGAGTYDHYIPAIVEYVSAKEEFVTAYTPYQPEISQGILQPIFEFQTMICELTGLDAANAGVYDGASAAAEAVSMCRERGRDICFLSEAMHPQVIETVRTYADGLGIRVGLIPLRDGRTDPDALRGLLAGAPAAAVCIAQPNFYGLIEDAAGIGAIAHEAGAKFVMSCEPVSLAVLAPPGECGADIAVGDGQPLGIPMSFGGPAFGYMACTAAMMRRLPGRIVGETADADGHRAFVLTLQAREQHIRREKASSNICSNQTLCTLTAGVYLSALGTKGLEDAALQSASKARYLAGRLAEMEGFGLEFPGPFFSEFVTRSPVPPAALEAKLAERGILCGLPLGGDLEGRILWCATEKNTREEIDRLADALKEIIATWN